MSSKITVVTQPKNRIAVTNKQDNQVKQVFVNSGGGGGGVSLLEQLIDVDSSNKANNNTLVYNDVSGKYVVSVLPLIDGGEF